MKKIVLFVLLGCGGDDSEIVRPDRFVVTCELYDSKDDEHIDTDRFCETFEEIGNPERDTAESVQYYRCMEDLQDRCECPESYEELRLEQDEVTRNYLWGCSPPLPLPYEEAR